MPSTRSLIVAALLSAPPLAAQLVPGPLRDDYPPALVTLALANADSLRLTAPQRRAIELRQVRMTEAVTPLRAQIAGLREGRDVRSLAHADRHAVMVAARAMREAVLAHIDSANADVRAALMPDQLVRLDALVAASPGAGGMAHGGGCCGRRMQPADSSGMHRRGDATGGAGAAGPHRHRR